MFGKPIVGITMGDPASIGPEIAVKALLNKYVYEMCNPLLVGDANVFNDIIKRLKLNATINAIDNVADAKFKFGKIDVIDLHNVKMKQLAFGKVSAMAGEAIRARAASAQRLAPAMRAIMCAVVA